jgi:hypothetical protein
MMNLPSALSVAPSPSIDRWGQDCSKPYEEALCIDLTECRLSLSDLILSASVCRA